MAYRVSVDRSKETMVLITDYDYYSKVRKGSSAKRVDYDIRRQLEARYYDDDDGE